MAEGVGVAPTLVFGYGNPSRGDDALGWRLIEQLDALRAAGRLAGVDLLSDFQLQIEHVLDLRGRTRVIFVDAELGEAPGGLARRGDGLRSGPRRSLGGPAMPSTRTSSPVYLIACTRMIAARCCKSWRSAAGAPTWAPV